MCEYILYIYVYILEVYMCVSTTVFGNFEAHCNECVISTSDQVQVKYLASACAPVFVLVERIV